MSAAATTPPAMSEDDAAELIAAMLEMDPPHLPPPSAPESGVDVREKCATAFRAAPPSRPRQRRLTAAAVEAFRRVRAVPGHVEAMDWLWFNVAAADGAHDAFRQCCERLAPAAEAVFGPFVGRDGFAPSRSLESLERLRVLYDVFVAVRFFPVANTERRMFMALSHMFQYVFCSTWMFQKPLERAWQAPDGAVYFHYTRSDAHHGRTRRRSRTEGSPTMHDNGVYRLVTPPAQWPAGLLVSNITDAQALALLCLRPDVIGVLRCVDPAPTVAVHPAEALLYPALWDGTNLCLLTDYLVSALMPFAPGFDLSHHSFKLKRTEVPTIGTFMRRADHHLIPTQWAPSRVRRHRVLCRNTGKPFVVDSDAIRIAALDLHEPVKVVPPRSWECDQPLLERMRRIVDETLRSAVSTIVRRDGDIAAVHKRGGVFEEDAPENDGVSSVQNPFDLPDRMCEVVVDVDYAHTALHELAAAADGMLPEVSDLYYGQTALRELEEGGSLLEVDGWEDAE